MNHMEMLKTHPRKTAVDHKMLAECIEASLACVDACNSCADACLGEQVIDALRRCILLDQDCADACLAAARILGRHTEPAWALVRSQLQAMEIACRLCAEECERHAKKHEHCRLCAETCRKGEASARRMITALPAQAGTPRARVGAPLPLASRPARLATRARIAIGPWIRTIRHDRSAAARLHPVDARFPTSAETSYECSPCPRSESPPSA